MHGRRRYEAQATKARTGEKTPGMVDRDTRIAVELVPSRPDSCLHLTLRSSNDALIKAAVIFADRLFEGGESVAVHEKIPSPELRVPLAHAKDVPAELQIKALVGGRASQTYQVRAVRPPWPVSVRRGRPSMTFGGLPARRSSRSPQPPLFPQLTLGAPSPLRSSGL